MARSLSLAALSGLALPGLALIVAVAGDARAQEAPACKAKERSVVRGTPVLGGPGLGFEIVTVVDKDACLQTLATSEDGSFALVLLEADKKLGWVATGLVDQRLSASAPEPPTPLPAEGKMRAVRTLVLRSAPRFDALAVAMPIGKEVELTLKGLSPDGQWYLLEAPKDAAALIGEAPDAAEGGPAGWAPKYKVAEKLPEAGAKPSAGSGGWAETRSGRKPYGQTPPALAAGEPSAKSGEAPPKPGEADSKKVAREKASGEKTAGQKTGGQKVAEEKVAEPGTEGSPDEAKPAVAAAPLGPILGRTQEAFFHVGYRYWQENYLSDAANDAFYKYDWVAPALVDLSGGYSYRGDFPLTVDVIASFALGGGLHPAVAPGEKPAVFYPDPDGDPTPLIAAQLHFQPRVGWRLFETANVDVDAGGGLSLDALINYNMSPLNPAPQIIVSGVYAGVGPSLVARSRLGDNGRFGLVVIEAQIPLGLYSMFPDPGGIYQNLPPEEQTILVPPPAGTPEDPVAPPPAFPVHLAAGVDGCLRYQYAFTNLLRVEALAGVTVRQAAIGGPGYRTGAYSKATNVDVMANLGLGMTFGF